MEKIVETIRKFNISALLVIGGFEVQDASSNNQTGSSRILFHGINDTSKRFSHLSVTFKGVRRCAAAV